MLRSTPVRENNMFSIWGSKSTVLQRQNLSEMFLLIDESEDFNFTNSAKHVDFFNLTKRQLYMYIIQNNP